MPAILGACHCHFYCLGLPGREFWEEWRMGFLPAYFQGSTCILFCHHRSLCAFWSGMPAAAWVHLEWASYGVLGGACTCLACLEGGLCISPPGCIFLLFYLEQAWTLGDHLEGRGRRPAILYWREAAPGVIPACLEGISFPTVRLSTWEGFSWVFILTWEWRGLPAWDACTVPANSCLHWDLGSAWGPGRWVPPAILWKRFCSGGGGGRSHLQGLFYSFRG